MLQWCVGNWKHQTNAYIYIYIYIYRYFELFFLNSRFSPSQLPLSSGVAFFRLFLCKQWLRSRETTWLQGMPAIWLQGRRWCLRLGQWPHRHHLLVLSLTWIWGDQRQSFTLKWWKTRRRLIRSTSGRPRRILKPVKAPSLLVLTRSLRHLHRSSRLQFAFVHSWHQHRNGLKGIKCLSRTRCSSR